MGRIVISAYRPKAGKEAELHALMKTHLLRLREQNLVTDRDSIVMSAGDGTIIEVFEWKSKKAIEQAHENSAVQKMWTEFGEVCDFVPVGQVAESEVLFSEFTPFDIG